GLYCALRALRTNGSGRWVLICSAGALFMLSTLSKETGLIFPVLWGAILLLKKNWKALLPATATALFVAVIYLTLRLSADHVAPPTLHAPPPLLVRPVLAARAFAEYTGLILFPI